MPIFSLRFFPMVLPTSFQVFPGVSSVFPCFSHVFPMFFPTFSHLPVARGRRGLDAAAQLGLPRRGRAGRDAAGGEGRRGGGHQQRRHGDALRGVQRWGMDRGNDVSGMYILYNRYIFFFLKACGDCSVAAYAHKFSQASSSYIYIYIYNYLTNNMVVGE